MSRETPNNHGVLLENTAPDHRLEGVPDSLWRRILEAGQAASTINTSEIRPLGGDEIQSLPDNSSNLRLLVEAAQNVENNFSVDDSEINSNHRTETSRFIGDQDGEATLAIGEVILNGTGVGESHAGFADTSHPRGQHTIPAIYELAIRHSDLAHQVRPATSLRSGSNGNLSYSERDRVLRGSNLTDDAPSALERHRHTSTTQADGPLHPDDPASNTLIASNPDTSSNDLPAVHSNNISRSVTARVDLENALRAYRIARRNLRNHASGENTSSANHNSPSHQGVLAQLSEQQNNHRNRNYPIALSRSHALESAHGTLSRIAAAAGLSGEPWQSDEEVQVTTGGVTNRRRQTMLPATIDTHEPYLGPTPRMRGVGIAPGGNRDSLRQIDLRERDARQAGPPFERPRFPSIGAADDPEISLRLLTNRDLGPNQEQRLQDTLERFTTTVFSQHDKSKKPSMNGIKYKAKSALKYLSGLKTLHNNTDRALALAKQLGVHDTANDLEKRSQNDLPLRIDELPRVRYSSMLSAGMSWKGVQKGGFARADSDHSPMPSGFTSGPLFEDDFEDRLISNFRNSRHRDRYRMRQQSAAHVRAAAQAVARRSEQSLDSHTRDEASGLVSSTNQQWQMLADFETHLADVLEENQGRLTRDTDHEWMISSTSPRPRTSTLPASAAEKETVEDKWPVQVIIHEVNWNAMTIAGTMVASQITNRTIPSTGNNGGPSSANTNPTTNANADKDKDKSDDSQSMETFFDGEIIDFRTHELETILGKPGYKVGGLMNDLKYWSRIGPFKAEIRKRIKDVRDKKAMETYARLGIRGTLDEQRAEYKRTFNEENSVPEELSLDEAKKVVYNTMIDCLGSRKWLEQACGEGGWVLMRWKERCFMTPPTTRPSSSCSEGDNNGANEPSRFGIIFNGTSATHQWTTSYTDDRHPARNGVWGLTIQGFYYAALHRMSGRIEALYYDHGSQPFQELVVRPVGSALEENKDDEDDFYSDLGDVGIRKTFGIVNFR